MYNFKLYMGHSSKFTREKEIASLMAIWQLPHCNHKPLAKQVLASMSFLHPKYVNLFNLK